MRIPRCLLAAALLCAGAPAASAGDLSNFCAAYDAHWLASEPLACYAYVGTPLTGSSHSWQAHQAVCATLAQRMSPYVRGRLAVIPTQARNTELYTAVLVPVDLDAQIGLHGDAAVGTKDVFYWYKDADTKQASLSESAFTEGNLDTGKECHLLKKDGQWNGIDCTSLDGYGVLCEITAPSACAVWPCGAAGTCDQDAGDPAQFTCTCPAELAGDYCQDLAAASMATKCGGGDGDMVVKHDASVSALSCYAMGTSRDALGSKMTFASAWQVCQNKLPVVNANAPADITLKARVPYMRTEAVFDYVHAAMQAQDVDDAWIGLVDNSSAPSGSFGSHYFTDGGSTSGGFYPYGNPILFVSPSLNFDRDDEQFCTRMKKGDGKWEDKACGNNDGRPMCEFYYEPTPSCGMSPSASTGCSDTCDYGTEAATSYGPTVGGCAQSYQTSSTFGACAQTPCQDCSSEPEKGLCDAAGGFYAHHSCYYLLDLPTTIWQDAFAVCQSAGGQLARMHDFDELWRHVVAWLLDKHPGVHVAIGAKYIAETVGGQSTGFYNWMTDAATGGGYVQSGEHGAAPAGTQQCMSLTAVTSGHQVDSARVVECAAVDGDQPVTSAMCMNETAYMDLRKRAGRRIAIKAGGPALVDKGTVDNEWHCGLLCRRHGLDCLALNYRLSTKGCELAMVKAGARYDLVGANGVAKQMYYIVTDSGYNLYSRIY